MKLWHRTLQSLTPDSQAVLLVLIALGLVASSADLLPAVYSNTVMTTSIVAMFLLHTTAAVLKFRRLAHAEQADARVRR